MEFITIFKFGKPSISMGHLHHGYVSHNQRVIPPNLLVKVATLTIKQHQELLSGYDKHSHDIDGPFIDGLPGFTY